jgi:hypothetical protein
MAPTVVQKNIDFDTKKPMLKPSVQKKSCYVPMNQIPYAREGDSPPTLIGADHQWTIPSKLAGAFVESV